MAAVAGRLAAVVTEWACRHRDMIFDSEWLQVIWSYAHLVPAQMMQLPVNRYRLSENLIDDAVRRVLASVPPDLAVTARL